MLLHTTDRQVSWSRQRTEPDSSKTTSEKCELHLNFTGRTQKRLKKPCGCPVKGGGRNVQRSRSPRCGLTVAGGLVFEICCLCTGVPEIGEFNLIGCLLLFAAAIVTCC